MNRVRTVHRHRAGYNIVRARATRAVPIYLYFSFVTIFSTTVLQCTTCGQRTRFVSYTTTIGFGRRGRTGKEDRNYVFRAIFFSDAKRSYLSIGV